MIISFGTRCIHSAQVFVRFFPFTSDSLENSHTKNCLVRDRKKKEKRRQDGTTQMPDFIWGKEGNEDGQGTCSAPNNGLRLTEE